jgi:hypothetical protein
LSWLSFPSNRRDHPAIVNVYKLKAGAESLDNLANSTFLNAAFADFNKGQGILTEALFRVFFFSSCLFPN